MPEIGELLKIRMLLLFDTLPVIKLLALMLLVFVITAVLVGALLYVGYLYLKGLLAKRDVWENTAKELGLSVGVGGISIFKPLTGIYKGHQVEVRYYRIPRAVSVKYDPYTDVKVFLPSEFDFPFEVRAESSAIQTVAWAVGKGDFDLGIPEFDKNFYIDCPEQKAISTLLCANLPVGQTPNLAEDLLLTGKTFHDLKVTDEFVHITTDGEILQAAKIKPMLDSAVYLAKRIEEARKNSV